MRSIDMTYFSDSDYEWCACRVTMKPGCNRAVFSPPPGDGWTLEEWHPMPRDAGCTELVLLYCRELDKGDKTTPRATEVEEAN